MQERIELSFVEYMRRQIELILGPENKWYAGEALGHSPTDEEAVSHWITHGGAEDFSARHRVRGGCEPPQT